MPCSSCSGSSSSFVAANEFFTSGTIKLPASQDIFVTLAYMFPFAGSSADSYIASKVSQQLLINFEPTFFQIPYIYSAADNLENGNYTKTTEIKENQIISTYNIPYKRELIDASVTMTTYLNTTTNILFYEVPREFTYDSKDKASIAVVPNGSDYVGTLLIPRSFITYSNSTTNVYYGLTLTISPRIIDAAKLDATLMPLIADIEVQAHRVPYECSNLIPDYPYGVKCGGC